MEYVNETSDAISEAQEVDQPNPVTSANSTPNPTATFDVVTSPVIYRNYVKPSATPGGAQSLKVVKQSKDAANFAELEKDGYAVATENTYTSYEISTLAGIDDLVPEESQKIYIFNVGLRNIQSSKIAAIQKEFDKESNAFSNNGQTIDMREYINEAPGRQSVSAPVKLHDGIMALAEKDRAAAEALLQSLMASLGLTTA